MAAWRRTGTKSRHHNKNRSKGGNSQGKNIYNLDQRRHEAWHFLFGNMSFEEVAEMLLRAVRMKQGYYNRLWAERRIEM